MNNEEVKENHVKLSITAVETIRNFKPILELRDIVF